MVQVSYTPWFGIYNVTPSQCVTYTLGMVNTITPLVEEARLRIQWEKLRALLRRTYKELSRNQAFKIHGYKHNCIQTSLL